MAGTFLEFSITADSFFRWANAAETHEAELYSALAQIMKRQGEKSLADLFDALSRHEKLHCELLAQRAVSLDENPECTGIAGRTIWLAPHPDLSSDEHVALRDALLLALETEQSVADFYWTVASRATSNDLQALAGKLALEERQHVDRLKTLLTQVGA